MIIKLKIFVLFFKKIKNYCKRRLASWISYSILALCASLFLVAVLANVSHRVPIISNIGERISFPHKNEWKGNIELYDLDGPITIPIEVFVGGFSKKTNSNEDFKLLFVSNISESIPMVVKYKHNGVEYTKVEYLDFGSDYTLVCRFRFSVGE